MPAGKLDPISDAKADDTGEPEGKDGAGDFPGVEDAEAAVPNCEYGVTMGAATNSGVDAATDVGAATATAVVVTSGITLAFASAITASATSKASEAWVMESWRVDLRRFISSLRPSNFECSVGVVHDAAAAELGAEACGV